MLYNMDEWLTEQCLLCCSVNHIFISTLAYAWQCHCCDTQTWLSDEDRQLYSEINNIDTPTTDYELAERIVYPSLLGLMERTDD